MPSKLLFFFCLISHSAFSQDLSLSLTGEWKLLTGEEAASPQFLSPDFNDAKWPSVHAPMAWDKQKGFEGFSGFGVYRKSFPIPASAKGKSLSAVLGKIASVDEAYFNGALIGRTGEVKIGSDLEPRVYSIPDSLIRYGKKNTIAVRVYCRQSDGGIYEGLGTEKNIIGIFGKTSLRKILNKPSKPVKHSLAADIQKTIREMDDALFSGRENIYANFLSESYFNNGTTYREQKLFLQSILPNVKGAKARYINFDVFEITPNKVVADYQTELYKNDSLFYVAQDERFFENERGVWKEIGNQARVFEMSVRSVFMKKEMRALIYLPPSFLNSPKKEYPSLYLLSPHGASPELWREIHIQERIDSLISKQSINEMIIIMPDESASFFVNAKTSNDKSQFERYFVNELISSIEEDFRAIGTRESRGITGVSWGGSAAFFLALKSAQARLMFASVSATMPTFNQIFNEKEIDGGDANFWRAYRVSAIIDSLRKEDLAHFTFHITKGSEDFYRSNTDEVISKLKSKTNRLTVGEYAGGNSFEFWQKHLDEAVMFHSAQFNSRRP